MQGRNTEPWWVFASLLDCFRVGVGGWVGEGCCAVCSSVRGTAFVLGDGMEVLTQEPTA